MSRKPNAYVYVDIKNDYDDNASVMPVDFQHIRFLLGAHELRQLPADSGAEVAFAGRSNAGKSSAINSITRRRGLARTSKTPGRTREINLFELADERRLVDLPGYGYAKVSDKVRRHWQHTLSAYLHKRRCLRGLILLMDVRHPLTEYDQAMVHWCAEVDMPLHALLTKSDKLSRGAGHGVLHKVQSELAGVLPQAEVQLFSALKNTGVEQARERILSWLDHAA